MDDGPNLSRDDLDMAIRLAMVIVMRSIKDRVKTVQVPAVVLAALNAAACITLADMETHGIDEISERGYGSGERQ